MYMFDRTQFIFPHIQLSYNIIVIIHVDVDVHVHVNVLFDFNEKPYWPL